MLFVGLLTGADGVWGHPPSLALPEVLVGAVQSVPSGVAGSAVGVWSDAAGGYSIDLADGSGPGVVAYDSSTGLATFRDASADWSAGPIGVPLVGSSFSFVPLSSQSGCFFDPERLAFAFGVGASVGVSWWFGLLLCGYVMGGLVHATAGVASGG